MFKNLMKKDLSTFVLKLGFFKMAKVSTLNLHKTDCIFYIDTKCLHKIKLTGIILTKCLVWWAEHDLFQV